MTHGSFPIGRAIHDALGIRPHCGCCGGGEFRKGRSMTRSASNKHNRKHAKAKPKSKDINRETPRRIDWERV